MRCEIMHLKSIFMMTAFTIAAAGASVALSDQIAGQARVVDGDTLVVDDRKIRLNGVDAPEMRQNCLDASNEWYPCGNEAAQALSRRISGQPVTCVLNPQPDRYGRAIGTCWFSDGEDMQSWLVRWGWAVAYRRYSSRYLHDESRARGNRSGIWRGRFVVPWHWRRGARLQ